MDLALAAIRQGHWQDARGVLQSFLRETPGHPTALNNLAAIQCDIDHAPEQALATLQPNLAPAAGAQPFARALAARCLVQLGQPDAARDLLAQAADDLGTALRRLPPGRGSFGRSTREFTVVLLEAAAALQDDRLVLDLYDRFQSAHVEPQAHSYAAVAAIHRGRLERAKTMLSRIRGPERGVAEALEDLLDLLQAGIVRPFRLPFDLPARDEAHARVQRHAEDLVEALGPPEAVGAEQKERAEAALRDPFMRLVLLGQAFGRDAGKSSADVRDSAIRALVRFGGEDGAHLGRAVLASETLPAACKFAAAAGLAEAGLIPENGRVQMWLDGQERTFEMSRPRLVTDGEEAERQYATAKAALQEGRRDEAIALLAPLADIRGTVYPPAVLDYVALLREDREYGDARNLIDTLLDPYPRHPAVLASAIRLAIEVRDLARARELLRSLGEVTGTAGLRKDLRRSLSGMEDVEAKLRELVARDPSHGALSALPPGATLAQALSELPPAWVWAALDLYRLPAAEAADEGRAALARHLREQPGQALQRAVACAPRPGLQLLLARLAKAGGRLQLEALDEFLQDRAADAVFSAGDRPTSVIGHARLAGFAYFGRMRAHGVERPVVGIPLELRDVLASLGSLADLDGL